MALAKQINVIALHNSNFDGGNGDSGSSDPNLVPTNWDAGYADAEIYIIDTSNYDIRITPEFYDGNPSDKALSGKLRQNLRGYRINVDLSYNANVQPTIIRNLFDDIIDAFVDNNVDSITFHPDENAKTNSFEVILDDSQYNSVYEGTVASFIPSLSLIALDEITSIPSYLEAP